MTTEADFVPGQQAGPLLWIHVLQKGYQAGGLLGWTLVAPIMAIRAGGVRPDMVLRAAGYGAVGGLAATAVLGAVKISQIDQDGLEDRAYRLHYNTSQNRVDRFSQVGSLVGLGAAVLASGGRGPALTLIGGAAAGSTLGLLAHLATAAKPDNEGPNRMLHELKTSQ